MNGNELKQIVEIIHKRYDAIMEEMKSIPHGEYYGIPLSEIDWNDPKIVIPLVFDYRDAIEALKKRLVLE